MTPRRIGMVRSWLAALMVSFAAGAAVGWSAASTHSKRPAPIGVVSNAHELAGTPQALTAEIRNLNLSGQRLTGVDLHNARLTNVRLWRADLRSSDFSGAHFTFVRTDPIRVAD